MPRIGPSRTRRVLSRLHRWIALTLGLWFACVGITGSALVFWREIEAGPPPVLAEGPPLALTDIINAAERAWPAEAHIFRLFPPRPGEAIRVEALVPDAGGIDRRHMLHLDPVSGAVLHEVPWGSHWIHVFYLLHGGNLADGWIAKPVGFAGIAFLLLIAAGAWQWTRHDATPLREGLRPVSGLRGLRRRRNLHRSFGLWAALPLGIAAATGVTLRFPDTTRAILAPLGDRGAPATHRTEKPARAGQPISLDDAVALARTTLPGWRIVWIDLPGEFSDATMFAMAPPDAPLAAPARIEVILETGAIIGQHASVVETLRAWFMALHNGHAFGNLHRGFVVALGLLPGFLGTTGLLIWLRRRANAARARRRAATAAAE